MGFLNWFENNPQEEPSTGEQLSLLDNSKELVERQRVDGALVRKLYTKTIQDKGGTDRTYAMATEHLTQEVMGCGTQELYQQTGAKPHKRETLPVSAQSALLAAEVLANYELKGQDINGDEYDRHHQIVEAARQTDQRRRYPRSGLPGKGLSDR
jgi:hypothetical protein